jgi:hypothetical protein
MNALEIALASVSGDIKPTDFHVNCTPTRRWKRHSLPSHDTLIHKIKYYNTL